ncbi:hypothetical protein [Smaragdicoccus niigatensis]|uniref:hypothetical protein n=1 Tax=Smaragdicoccus niigatensis TaxID=359359 RepID=UPI000368E99A|nr:hypothetical protein [Smaragdicoccus niigatensis]
MNRYHAYGLEVSSDRAIAALVRKDAAPLADVAVIDAKIDTEGLSFAPLEDADASDAWVAYSWDTNRTVIRFPGVTAEFDLHHRQIKVDDSSADEGYAEHVVLDHVLPRWLSLSGDLVLHGSAVATARHAGIAFIGDTGRGKSTTATALAMRRCWTLLADDVCRIIDPQSTPLIVPSYPGVRLTSQSRTELTPDYASTPLAAGSDKGRVCPDVAPVYGPVPLRLVVALGENSASLDARRLGLGEATATLVRNIFHQARTLGDIAPQAFLLASEVAAGIPCYQVDFPRQWGVFDDLSELLESLV